MSIATLWVDNADAKSIRSGVERFDSEMILSPDGTALALVTAESHFDQNLFRLRLEPPTTEDGLPMARVVGTCTMAAGRTTVRTSSTPMTRTTAISTC
jgi:hypothetical protein